MERHKIHLIIKTHCNKNEISQIKNKVFYLKFLPPSLSLGLESKIVR